MSSKAQVLIMLPGPTNVPDRVMRALSTAMIGHRGSEFHELHDEIKEGLQYLFQTKGDVFALTCSGTGGIECAISNIVKPGDEVLVGVSGVFAERVAMAVERRGGKAIRVEAPWRRGVTVEEVKRVLEEREAKAVIIVYNETSTGVTNRHMREIARVAREHGALVVCDAISILGGDELPVDEWGIDICVGGSQKCIACPPGLAVLSVSERAWEVIEANPYRPFYFDLVRYREFSEKKKETPYTPALSLFWALNEALKIIREEGLENRIKRHRTCARAFYEAMKAMGLKIYPEAGWESNTVIAVEIPEGVEDAKLRRIMKEKYGILIAGGFDKLAGKIFRIGNMGIVSQREVLLTVAALENALRDLGYPLEVGAGLEAAKNVFSREL